MVVVTTSMSFGVWGEGQPPTSRCHSVARARSLALPAELLQQCVIVSEYSALLKAYGSLTDSAIERR